MKEPKKGTVVISVDDGCADSYRFYELLNRYQMGATFNIVTSMIGESSHLSLEQLQKIIEDPLMEIACHGHTHKNDSEDIKQANKVLFQWKNGPGELIGFASPGSRMKRTYVCENEKELKDLGLLYVRSSQNSILEPRHCQLKSKLQAEGFSNYVLQNVSQLVYDFSDMFVPSVVICHDTEPEDLKTLVSLAAQEKATIVFMFHRIKMENEEKYDDIWSYDFSKAENFLKFLSETQKCGTIDILTTREAFLKYRKSFAR